MISLTENAINRMRELLKSKENSSSIKIKVTKGGCSGLKYNISIISNPDIEDERVYSDNKLNIFVSKDSIFYLLNSEIDYTQDRFKSEFVFRNPNESGKCGCGKSFSI